MYHVSKAEAKKEQKDLETKTDEEEKSESVATDGFQYVKNDEESDDGLESSSFSGYVEESTAVEQFLPGIERKTKSIWFRRSLFSSTKSKALETTRIWNLLSGLVPRFSIP